MFQQDPPALGNQFRDDRVLRSYLARTLPEDALREAAPDLDHMGGLAGGELYLQQLDDRLNDPKIVNWDAWGRRVDRIELSPLWARAAVLAAQHGLVALAYERPHGRLSRVRQFALVHLFHPSTDVYSCPLAMTDGAAKTLTAHGATELMARALPHLTSRDPVRAWTSGQWMTERAGGSDVGLSETEARLVDGQWRLYGNKFFTSAATSQMALTLARMPDAPKGGRGLTLFYVETRDAHGRLNDITIHRLKEKLGTRKVPTAELDLVGTRAIPVTEPGNGIRNITPMLNVSRTWNAVCSVSAMRRAVALARDYANRRIAFGAPLSQKPLHVETMAGMQAEAEAGFHLAFRAVELLGADDLGDATPHEHELLRVVTPLAKLVTGKQAVDVVSEAVECVGGAGYMEDTGMPLLLRDAQVLPIWEGTTNVLSLEMLKGFARTGALAALHEEIAQLTEAVRDDGLRACAAACRSTLERAMAWAGERMALGGTATERGARGLALTLGRTLALALLVRHAQWSLDHEHDGRARAAARRFLRHGIDRLDTETCDVDAEAAALACDSPIA